VSYDKLFEGLSDALRMLQDAQSVVVVGNGPMSGNLGTQIDSSKAAIIRCNDYATATSADQHGARCDLQIISCDSRVSKTSFEPILEWIRDPQVQVIVLENHAPPKTIARLLQEGRNRNLKMGTVSEGASAVVLEHNVTRGFLAVALATHAMVSVGGTVDLYGFGGDGHHNDSNLHIDHHVAQECDLWRKLDSEVPWFTWHRSDIEQNSYGFQMQSGNVPVSSSSRTDASVGMMWKYAESEEANVLMWLIGDATWAAISKYDYNAETEGCCDSWDWPTLAAQPGQPWKAMLFNLSVKGAALRQNKRHQETRLANSVELCGMPGSTPFVPIQVPFQGGYHGQETGCSNEERFLESHDVLFTKTLVELVNTEQWRDKYHFTLEATMRVLEHVMVRVDDVLKQLEDSKPVQSPIIVCVLSDGWNRLFRGSDDRSRYWRCRLEFSKCTTLGQFKGWCKDYASSKPAHSPCLP